MPSFWREPRQDRDGASGRGASASVLKDDSKRRFEKSSAAASRKRERDVRGVLSPVVNAHRVDFRDPTLAILMLSSYVFMKASFERTLGGAVSRRVPLETRVHLEIRVCLSASVVFPGLRPRLVAPGARPRKSSHETHSPRAP